MGRGSTELVALKERLDELEVALEKIERILVLRGDRLARLEKVVNDLDKSVDKLNDTVGPLDLDKFADRVEALEKAFAAMSARISAVEPKPKSTSSRARGAEKVVA